MYYRHEFIPVLSEGNKAPKWEYDISSIMNYRDMFIPYLSAENYAPK